MSSHQIRGHWMKNGFVDGYGTLSVQIDADGIWDQGDRGPGEQLYCRQYGRDCPIITNGCWTFAPDEDQLAKLGIVPKQMISA